MELDCSLLIELRNGSNAGMFRIIPKHVCLYLSKHHSSVVSRADAFGGLNNPAFLEENREEENESVLLDLFSRIFFLPPADSGLKPFPEPLTVFQAKPGGFIYLFMLAFFLFFPPSTVPVWWCETQSHGCLTSGTVAVCGSTAYLLCLWHPVLAMLANAHS